MKFPESWIGVNFSVRSESAGPVVGFAHPPLHPAVLHRLQAEGGDGLPIEYCQVRAVRAVQLLHPQQVNIPGDGQHGHGDCPDHEPGAEARPGRPSLALPGGPQEQAAVRQVTAAHVILTAVSTPQDI